MNWRKSSYCGNSYACVETAATGDGVAVRDSQDLDGPVLVFSRAEWRWFLASVKAGKHGLS